MTNQKAQSTRFKVQGSKLKAIAMAAMLMATGSTANAGGINTNTNMSVAFARLPSRDAAIATDGVFFNPAGVVFLSPGIHMSVNWQFVTQRRYIDNQYPLFANNTENPTTTRRFKGETLAPVFPSIQFAYNWRDFSFQVSAGVTGGGGKCTFDDGLGSFEKLVSETALAASGLAKAVDASLAATLEGAGVPASSIAALAANGFSSDNYFGSTGKYSTTSFMRGRQYYYGVSFGVGYKATPNLGVFAGARGVYASCNYYGYLRNIKVGNMPLYKVLDPTKEGAADIELNADQSGFGVTPILGVDYKLGRWNFAAKYEFKTRMRLKNSSVNQFPSIGNLGSNLAAAVVGNLQAAGMSAAQAQGIAQTALSAPEVTGIMTQLKNKFDEGINEATGEYEDGKKIAADIPAIVTAGVSYNPIDPLRINAGFHYYFDKQATAYKHHEDKLDRGTIEYSFGGEYDATKWLTVSAGYQRTSYGLTDEYMNDKSFVVSSNSIGGGVMMHVTKRARVNVAYFHTFYETKKTNTVSESTGANYQADYTRNNSAFGVSLELDL